jgi:hopanoid biosynthesis associated protein HpnK
MVKYLIINGDDFGVSSFVNQAIIKAHQQGILTSTSLMVTGEAFTEAVSLAKANPSLGVGLHLVLGCGKAVLPHQTIPHLVDPQGNFPDDPVKAGLRYQFSSPAQAELKLEIRAQLEKFFHTGLKLSHLDGHLHHHVNPVVLKTIVELAQEFPIPFIRLPFEELNFTLKLDNNGLLTKLVTYSVFTALRRHGEGLLNTQGIGYLDRVYGLLQTGKINENYLLGLIPQINAKVVEIYTHPGAGENELEALLSKRVLDQIKLSGFELVNYHALEY